MSWLFLFGIVHSQLSTWLVHKGRWEKFKFIMHSRFDFIL